MADLAHAVAVQHTQQSTNDTDWVDCVTLSSSNFTGSRTYLLLVRAIVGGGINSLIFSYRTVHGSTEFTGSQLVTEPTGTEPNVLYTYMTVFTQAGSPEDIKLQFKTSNALFSALANDISIIALDITDLDYEFNEHTTGGTLTSSYASKASVTFTPGSESDYLIIGQTSIDVNSLTTDPFFQLYDGSASLIEFRKGGEDTAEIFLFQGMSVQTLAASSQTLSVQVKDSATGVNTYNSSRIFVIDLAQFSKSDSNYSASNGSGTQQLGTLSYTPDVTGDLIVLGCSAGLTGDANEDIYSRLQADNTSIPSGINDLVLAGDANEDIFSLFSQAVYSGTASTGVTFDFDGVESGGAGSFADSTLVVISLAIVDPLEQAVESTLSLTHSNTKSVEHNLSISQNLNLSDGPYASGDFTKTVVQTIGLLHQSTGNVGGDVDESLSSSLSLSHSVSTEGILNPFNNLNLNHILEYEVDWQLISTLTLSQVIVAEAPKLISHDLTITHEVSASKDVNRSFTDTLVLTHEAKSASFASSDLELGQSVSYVLLQQQNVEDSLNLTHFVGAYVLTKSVSSSLSLSHSVSHGLVRENELTNNLLSLSQSVVAVKNPLQPFIQNLDLSQEVQYYLTRNSVSHTLELSHSVGVNVEYNLDLCSNLTLDQRASRTFEELIVQTINLSHGFINPLESTIYLIQSVSTNALMHSCSTESYIPDKSITQSLNLSQSVQVLGDLNQAITHNLNLQATIAYFD